VLRPGRGLERDERRLRLSVNSRTWDLQVNLIAASNLASRSLRLAILRRCGVEIGTATVLPGCYLFSSDLRIGEGAWINHRCYFDTREHIEIGHRVNVGMEVMFCTSTHRAGPAQRRAADYCTAPIIVGDGSWIGTRAMVLPGAVIGDGCIVAAGSVVTGRCEPHGLYAGVPARRRRDLEA
jgi:maltose O-acetyltransferase